MFGTKYDILELTAIPADAGALRGDIARLQRQRRASKIKMWIAIIAIILALAIGGFRLAMVASMHTGTKAVHMVHLPLVIKSS